MLKTLQQIHMYYFGNNATRCEINMKKVDMSTFKSDSRFFILERNNTKIVFKDLYTKDIYFMQEIKQYFGNYYTYVIDYDASYGK